MENITATAKGNAKKVLEENNVDAYGKEFLEELMEALDNVEGMEDYGSTIEFYDEFGTVLFQVEVSGDTEYTFKFYENSYTVDNQIMEALLEALK